MGTNQTITNLGDGASAARLILRINPLDENGEMPSGITTDQVVVEGITGSPEGRALGSPGDIRVQRDVPRIWQKITGIRSLVGWAIVGAGVGGASTDSITFSIAGFAIPDDADTYFSFSGGRPPPTVPNFSQSFGALALFLEAAEKFASAAGRVTGLIMRSSLDATLELFVEIDDGGGFVRTVVNPAVVLTGGVVTPVTLSSLVPFALGDIIRVGLATSASVTTDLTAELQLSYP